MSSTIKLKNQIFALISIIVLISCTTFKDIAKDDTKYHAGTRAYAVKQITDQDFLIAIFKNDKDYIVRMAAVKGITNQAYLIEIYKNDKEDYDFREAAVEQMTDQAYLIEMFNDDRKYFIFRLAAVKGIKDQDLLISRYSKMMSGVMRSVWLLHGI